jgi:hypothetical protein
MPGALAQRACSIARRIAPTGRLRRLGNRAKSAWPARSDQPPLVTVRLRSDIVGTIVTLEPVGSEYVLVGPKDEVVLEVHSPSKRPEDADVEIDHSEGRSAFGRTRTGAPGTRHAQRSSSRAEAWSWLGVSLRALAQSDVPACGAVAAGAVPPSAAGRTCGRRGPRLFAWRGRSMSRSSCRADRRALGEIAATRASRALGPAVYPDRVPSAAGSERAAALPLRDADRLRARDRRLRGECRREGCARRLADVGAALLVRRPPLADPRGQRLLALRADGRRVRFLTGYDYGTRFGLPGQVIDRLALRPLLGWATAWSFDRLRLWRCGSGDRTHCRSSR